MGFQVGLSHHVQPVLITQIIEILVVAVVGGTDRVQVVLLHELYILLLGLQGNIFAIYRVGIVAVGSLQQKLLAVDPDRLKIGVLRLPVSIFIYLRFYELDLTEAQLLGNASQIGS